MVVLGFCDGSLGSAYSTVLVPIGNKLPDGAVVGREVKLPLRQCRLGSSHDTGVMSAGENRKISWGQAGWNSAMLSVKIRLV